MSVLKTANRYFSRSGYCQQILQH